MIEIKNPLEGVSDEELEINSAEEYWTTVHLTEFYSGLADPYKLHMDNVWELAFKIGKAEGMAARDDLLKNAVEERDAARGQWEDSNEERDRLTKELTEYKASRNDLQRTVAAYQENERKLADEKAELVQVIADVREMAAEFAAQTLQARRKLATAVGFPEEYVVLPNRG